MATSGSFNTTSYGSRYLTFSWERQSYSIENNTTTIKWTLKGAGGSSPGYYVSGNFKVTINGKQVYFSSKRINLWNNTVVATGTTTFNHNNDGTCSFSASAEAGIYTVAVNVSGSGSWDLETIPRASKPTASGTFQLGGSITISTNRASSSFTHTIRYGWGSMSGTIASGVGASTPWTILKSLANGIPNGTSGTLRIYCDTYNGSTKIGTGYKDYNVTMPNTSEFKPSVTGCTLTEAGSGIASQFNAFIQSKSKVSVNATASGAYGSSIKTWSININGSTYTSRTFTTGAIINSGSNSCVISITDSRNRSSSATYNFNVLAYSSPTISNLKAERCNSDGTLNDEGSSAKITISASITAVNSKNTKTYTLKYKKQSASTWTTVALPNTSYLLSTTKIINNIDVNSEYDFELEVEDFFGAVIKNVPLSTAFTLINFNSSGKALAFGKVSTKDTGFEVGMTMYDSEGSIVRSLPINSIFITTNNTNPSMHFGGTWVVFGTGRMIVGVDTAQTYFNTVMKTGGSATHTLTLNEMPSHTHPLAYGPSLSGSSTGYSYGLASGSATNDYSGKGWNGNIGTFATGGGVAHNNLSPYITAYFWRRTA